MGEWKIPNKDHRSNYLRALEFRSPEWIPCQMSFFPIMWKRYREDLVRLTERHPFIFGEHPSHPLNFDHLPRDHLPNQTWVDEWGVTWHTGPQGGFIGLVEKSPLEDWANLENYKFPVHRYKHWVVNRFINRQAKKRDRLVGMGADGLFDRIYFLRGFNNLMRDLVTGSPQMVRFLQMFQDYHVEWMQRLVKCQPDQIGFHTDIGAQDRLLLSPRLFRKYIKPVFSAIFQTCRKAGVHVYLHSDGHLLEIVDDLIECGVSVHDPQERANTLEGIAKFYKGKLCIDLDMDRQMVPFVTADALKKHVYRAIETLHSPEGGFMIKSEIADPNIPLENIEAICQAFEDKCIPKQ